MKLTRHQADLVLRHYTAEYAEKMREDPASDSLDSIKTLARKLAWRIDADLSSTPIAWLICAWLALLDAAPRADETANLEVNMILDAAGFRGPHILRYSEPVSA